MKEYGFHIIAFVCIVSLFVTACDKTIHQYPESEKTWVMVELNADRTPPVYYKELTYDAEGESSINDLEPVLSGNYTADERLCLRFVVELYKMPGATDDVNKGNLVERREISVERLTDAPQDTLYFCLADGIYKVLAWADYVPKEEPADWHFSTDKLDAVRANVSHKPLDNHHKNSAAGNCDFIVDSSRDDKAGPVRLSGNDASGAAADDRMVSVYMERASGRFRLWATDLQEFRKKRSAVDDLHYNTSDFTDISIKDGLDAQLNDESRDAYFFMKNISVTQTFGETMTLKRPFAKLRVITTDWASEGMEMPDNFKVAYHDCVRFSALNAVTGEAVGSADAESSKVYTASIMQDETGDKFYEGGYDVTANNRTLVVDYLITGDEQRAIHFSLEMLKGTAPVVTKDFTTNIPVQRNYLTTILGNLLTVGGTIDVDIQEGFKNEWIEGEEWWNPEEITPSQPAYDEQTNTYSVYTREEFAWLPTHIDDMLTATPGFTLRICNDIDMSGVEWSPIYPGSSGRTYTVDGQGHTLRNFSMSGKFGAVYEYKLGSFVLGRYNAYTGVWGKFDGIMKNLTFENITINGLAHAEFPVKDVDGEPVDHSKEFSYFAGCIGYTGGNQWSMNSKFENVHVRHIQIKSSATPSQNLGGLVGWIGSGGGNAGNRVAALKNCSATDVHLTGYQAGGLVGQVLGDRGVSFDDCQTENVYIRYSSISSSSGFIGNIGDGGINISWSAAIEINNCNPAQNVYYINDRTGEPNTTYKPQSPFYGHKNSVDVVTITPEETTEP